MIHALEKEITKLQRGTNHKACMTQLDLKNDEIQKLRARISMLETEKEDWGMLMAKRANEVQKLQLENHQLVHSLEKSVNTQSELRKTIASLKVAETTPDVIFLHDSLGKAINATLCQREGLSAEKTLTYTLAEAKKQIKGLKTAPRLLALHVGTNDLPRRNRKDEIDAVLDKMDGIVALVKEKFPTTKILISLLLPRRDCGWKSRLVQYVNSCLHIDYDEDPAVILCEHPDVGDEHLASDKLHLKPEGTAKLAMDLRRTITTALGIPLQEKLR